MEKTIGILYAPIEIESPSQLETLGITWQDVVPLRVGRRTVRVYLAPAPEEVSRYMLRELRRKYSKEGRATRCGVPGAGGRLRYCPDSNSCDDCSRPESGLGRMPRLGSLDAMVEEGWDCASPEAGPQEKAELRDLLERIGRVNPVCLRALRLKADGLTEAEIGEELGLSAQAVHRALVRARQLAGEYMEE